MDHADPSLARGPEPLYDSMAGSNAGPGESRVMKAQNLSTSLGEGRDAAPSLAHLSQNQKLNLAVYTEELTHLTLSNHLIGEGLGKPEMVGLGFPTTFTTPS